MAISHSDTRLYKDTLISDIVQYTDPNVDWNAPNYGY
jgi:hypothetical protein